MFDDLGLLTLVAITLAAAVVNGALGYGFSSITVPVALLFYTNRVLNPALILVEVAINGYVLVMNRASVRAVWRRVLPMLVGLVPGIVAGSYVLSAIDPAWLKLAVYAVLLPLILLQAAGVRRPIHSERIVGVPFGAGVGVLYSATTISGPPLALLFNNQGLVKQEFRAALGLIRVAESTLTAIAYYYLGLYTVTSVELLPWIVPSVVLGIPIGAVLIRTLDAETFRRICMSFDAWVVGFGASRIVADLGLSASPRAYGVLALAVAIDTVLLYRFFARQRAGPAGSASPGAADPRGAPAPAAALDRRDVRLLDEPVRAPVTAVERLAVATLREEGAMVVRTLAERVAAPLYRAELRQGAGVLDLGLFGWRLFVREVTHALESADRILWTIEKPSGQPSGGR